MPRFPGLSAPTQVLPASILDTLKRRAAGFGGPVIPLHIGDTHLAPPEKSRLGALGFSTGRDPDLYRYSPPPGKQALLEALADKLHRHNRIAAAGAENVQVTVGATHALACAIRALLDPGDHILLPSPFWPHIRGVAMAAGVRLIEAPFTHVLLRQPGADPEELLERTVTPQRSLYQATRDAVHARLGDLCLRPEGSTYLFLDLSRFRRGGEEDALGALERIADAGVLLAPGAAFGHDDGDWARLCFTSVDRPALDEAVGRIIRVLHR